MNVYGSTNHSRILNMIQTHVRTIEKSTLNLSGGIMKPAPADVLRISRLEAEIRAGSAARRNMQEGISLLQTAESALANVQSMAHRLNELSVQYHGGILQEADKKAIEEEAKALAEEMVETLEHTKYNGQSVFDEESFRIHTGPGAEDTYMVAIPSSLNRAQDDSSQALSMSSYSLMFALMASDADGSQLQRYTLPAPDTGIIPEQDGFSGYKLIRDESGNLIYDGSLKDGTADGFGRLYDGDRLIYEGSWKMGVMDGYGTLYGPDGKLKYQGMTTEGVPDGWGTYYDDNGIRYQGSFEDGYRQGWGTTFDENGQAAESQHYTDYDTHQVEPPGSGGDNGGGNGGGNGGDNGGGNGGGNGGDNGGDNGGGNIITPVSLRELHRVDVEDLLNTEFLKQNVQEPLIEARSRLGIQESILERRLSFREDVSLIYQDQLDRITGTDIAKEIMVKVRHEMLLSMATLMLTKQLDQRRERIMSLLDVT